MHIKASILIYNKWHRCVVERIDDVPHWSGQTLKRYVCKFPNGSIICCGSNSIRLNSPRPERTPTHGQ